MNIPVVILCGGKGFRIRADFPEVPKPLIEVAGKTILERVMNLYIQQGYCEFYLCLGFEGEKIVRHFGGELLADDYKSSTHLTFQYTNHQTQNITIHFINTGLETQTGGRLKQLNPLLKEYPIFFLTYADAISAINLQELLKFHLYSKRIATVTAVRPQLNFGFLKIQNGEVMQFQEKPISPDWINGGFFVFNYEIFQYLKEDEILEIETVQNLINIKQLNAFQSTDLWLCMDTYKDYVEMTKHFNRVHEPSA